MPPAVARRATACAAVSLILVLVLGTAAVAASAGQPIKGGHYHGSVGPGWPLHFSVSKDGKTVESLVAGFDPGCAGGAPNVAPLFHFAPLAIHDGGFSGTTTRHFGSTVTQTVHFVGHFDGHKASGKVTDRLVITSLKPCTEPADFTAKTG
jgi:hypothetical protein